MVALVILSMLAVVLVGVIPSTIAALKGAENRAKASCLARDAMERLRSGSFDQIQAEDASKHMSNGTEFEISVRVDPVAREGGGGSLDVGKIKRVSVRVTWKERNSSLSHTLSTLCFRP